MIYETFLQSLSFWYLISARQKISFFIFCCFKDLRELKKLGDFNNVNILSWEAAGALEPHEGSHDAKTGMGGVTHLPGRATRDRLAIKRRLGFVFLCMPPSWKKSYAIFFLEFWGSSRGETLLPPPEGLIMSFCCRCCWEIAAIIATDFSLAWGGAYWSPSLPSPTSAPSPPRDPTSSLS
jgi:hypothetical protein